MEKADLARLTRDVQDMHAERDALRGEVSKLQAALARLEKEIQDRESKTNTLSGPQGLVTGRDSLLEGILEYSSAFIYMKDLEGRYIMPSGKTTGFHRRTEDIVGKTAYDVYPREVADVFVAHDRVVIETDTQQEFEETFYLEDGIFSLLSVIFPVRDSTGKTYAVCGISTDITERRRAEEAYHVLVNNSLQGLAIYRDDRIVFANPAMSEITGYSPAELLELANPVDVLAHPLDIEFIRNQFRDRSNSKPFASPVEYRIAHKDGGVRWVETNTIQIAYEGKPALQVVYLDVTDRKHAESILEEQRILAETLGDIASILNSTLDLDEVLERILANVERVVPNDAVCVMLIDEDSKSARVARQKNHSETGNAEPFVNAPIDISDNPELKAMIKGTAPVVMPEVYKMFKWVRSEDHGWISSYAGVPITFGTKVIGFLNLVSATPRFFDTILAQRLQAFASQASIAISNARLYSQAHDLAALNERQRLAREMHDSVSQTLFSASVVAETLPRLWDRDPEGVKKDLFGLQRLTRGALAEMRTLLVELRPQALINADLGDLIRQLADGLAGRTEVEVILDIQGQHPLPAEVQTAFFRIAQESLNNVVKHARAGHVWIDYHNQVDDVSLCIRDNGCGFDMSNLPAERLGLKILHERAASIGANMRIESRPGCGTTVKVDWQGQQG